eukprot:359739-Chlamydomonas_euryale.AAC.3
MQGCEMFVCLRGGRLRATLQKPRMGNMHRGYKMYRGYVPVHEVLLDTGQLEGGSAGGREAARKEGGSEVGRIGRREGRSEVGRDWSVSHMTKATLCTCFLQTLKQWSGFQSAALSAASDMSRKAGRALCGQGHVMDAKTDGTKWARGMDGGGDQIGRMHNMEGVIGCGGCITWRG